MQRRSWSLSQTLWHSFAGLQIIPKLNKVDLLHSGLPSCATTWSRLAPSRRRPASTTPRRNLCSPRWTFSIPDSQKGAAGARLCHWFNSDLISSSSSALTLQELRLLGWWSSHRFASPSSSIENDNHHNWRQTMTLSVSSATFHWPNTSLRSMCTPLASLWRWTMSSDNQHDCCQY